MGKKARQRRKDEHENFAIKRSKEKLRNRIIVIGVAVVVVLVIGYSVFLFTQLQTTAPDAPPGVGALGSEHSHLGILAIIFGKEVNFSAQEFQLKNRFTHFEGQNGFTIHRHATNIPLGFFLDTIGIKLDQNCIKLPDKNELCNDDKYSLKFFVNKKQIDDISNYIGQDGDRVLVSYGNETPEELEVQLGMVDIPTIEK